jgi:inner membrane protein
MDNLTHSLAGAVLGQMGLKRKTGLAMPTLIIAANLPDIDAFAVLLGGHQHLALRRGITHGPIAMLVLPLILWAAMLWFDRWQERRGTRPDKRLPVHRGWLLALAFIGTLSHPMLDWLNNYGVRLLEPFSSEWFYGDTLFIIDVWVWAALGFGLWLSLRRERDDHLAWKRPARIAGGLSLAYVAVNFAISSRAEMWMKSDAPYPATAVASAVPIAFWQREVLWRQGESYGSLPYALVGPEPSRLGDVAAVKVNGMGDARIRAAMERDPDARAFLFWSRMPVATVEKDAIVIRDQRFMDPRVGDRFTLRIPLDEAAAVSKPKL